MVDVPTSFTEAPSESAKEVAAPERWWELLDDPDLDALIDEALANNQELSAAWASLRQADAIARQSGASLLPSVDAKLTATESRGHDDGVKTSNPRSYSAGLTASYEVDLWGRVRAGVRAAELDREASAETLQATAMTLTASVARTWQQLVEQRAQLALITSQRQINEDTLELVTLRYRQGLSTAADVLRQRQLVESKSGELAQARARRATLEHQLAVLLGRAPGTASIPQNEELIATPSVPATGLPAELVARRPDLRAAAASLAAADQRVAVAIRDRYPKLTLSASATTNAASTSELFDSWLSNISAQLLGPLFDGGRRRAEVERQRAIAEQSLARYAQATLVAFREVEDALVSEREQRAYLASLETQLELAAETLIATRQRYANGDLTYIDVLSAQQSHQQLERSVLTARRQQTEFVIELCSALGGGWELEEHPRAAERAALPRSER